MKLLSILLILTINDLINCLENTNYQKPYNPADLLSNIFGSALKLSDEEGNESQLADVEQLEDNNEPRQYGVVFDQDKPLIFDDTDQNYDPEQIVPQKQNKKRRRRRKPKKQNFQNYSNLGYPGSNTFGVNPYTNPSFSVPNGPYYNPTHRPKPSIGSEALSTIYGALTSIALYDDQQCVPRLLSEAAGGGTLGSMSIPQSVAGLQPLLTLLSAYNGISTSPLFVFGRAVFLGVTSKGNPGICRYAYPQCPTDPEKLVNYLNNHNGGFFRFFNAPQGQYNLNQFYNHLSSGYGLYQPNLNHQDYNGQSNFGYGFYKPNQQGQNDFRFDQGYGFYKPLSTNEQTYSPGFKYDKFNFENDNDIEKRILNNPSNDNLADNFDNEFEDTKLSFPDNDQFYISDNNIRNDRTLKFPDETFNAIATSNQNIYNVYKTDDYKRKGKTISFPENSKYITNKDKYNNPHKYVNTNDYVFDHKHNFYVKNMNDNDDIRTVYIVRGNGDPNFPEIVKIRPGESVS